MKLHYYFTIGLIGFSIGIADAQNAKIKKGKNDYQRFSYSKAINDYESADKKTTDAQRELAESYYISGNTGKAESYYASVVQAPDARVEDYYRYSSILKVNGKYEDADTWMKKYGEKKSSDSRVSEYNLQPMAAQKLLKDEGRFEIVNLDINSPQEDFGPVYYGNKLVFASSREGVKAVERRWNGNGLPFLDVYVGNIGDRGQISEPASLTKKVNKKYHEGPATFSADGTLMICTRDNYHERAADGTINLQLFSEEYKDGKWKNEQPLPFNNKEYSVGHPSLTPDGNTLYFVSNMPGGFGGTDIYKSVKQADGSWGKAENLGKEINTEGNEMFPFYHSSGILFFASDGHVGLGGLDVFLTQVKPEGFGTIRNLGIPVNSSRDDFSLILDKDMKSGYFSSNRDGGKGDDDIYAYNLLKPFTFGKTIKGIAKDKQGNSVAGALVKLKDESGKEIGTVTTGADGAYSFSTDADKKFSLNGSRNNYFDGNTPVSTAVKDDVVEADVVLEKDPGLSLYGLVTEKGSTTPIENVKIKLINNITGKEERIVTPAAGDFRKVLGENKLNDRISYNLVLEKDGYLSKTVTYSKTLDKEGQYSIQQEMDLSLDKIAVGTDLAKLINIKPIYFDLGKYVIRKDASVELDKIVKVMNENPTMVVELGSHTDCRGTAAANEKLSDNRAKASAEYVKKRITNPERIYGKGYGESKLKNGCACEGTVKSTCTETEHQENRRTEFIIIKM